MHAFTCGSCRTTLEATDGVHLLLRVIAHRRAPPASACAHPHPADAWALGPSRCALPHASRRARAHAGGGRR